MTSARCPCTGERLGGDLGPQRRASACLGRAVHIVSWQSRSRAPCSLPNFSRSDRNKADSRAPIALIPFFGGGPSTTATGNRGNAHSAATRSIKLEWLRATICSIRRHLRARVVVGVCTKEDEAAVKQQWCAIICAPSSRKRLRLRLQCFAISIAAPLISRHQGHRRLGSRFGGNWLPAQQQQFGTCPAVALPEVSMRGEHLLVLHPHPRTAVKNPARVMEGAACILQRMRPGDAFCPRPAQPTAPPPLAFGRR